MTRLEKEIRDQKTELRAIFDLLSKQSLDLSPFLQADCIYFVGCGSSYYLAISAAKYFSKQIGVLTKAIPGGEVAFNFEENVSRRAGSPLAILISRSGESTETVLAARKFREHSIRTFSLTLNSNSKLRKICDDGLVLPVEESSIVMTKSFSSMLLSLFVIADTAIKGDLQAYRSIFDHVDYFFEDFTFLTLEDLRHPVFLGKGVYEGIARESALKVEEMSLTPAETYSTFEYRHGPKSSITNDTIVIIFLAGSKEEQDLVTEMKEYGARVIERTSIDPSGRDAFLHVVFSQLMGVHLAKLKGVNPEQPRNLTHVVEFDV